MRTVTLELLRHGPSHGQLLSRLTPYLALSGNHAAQTVYVPFDHGEWLNCAEQLSYPKGEMDRTARVDEVSSKLAEWLGQIPGWLVEMNLARTPQGGEPKTPAPQEDEPIHLRIVLSSSELALLPFEMTKAPHGLPGAGQPLLLQSQTPICLTREVRRISTPPDVWPVSPRILFVISQAGGQVPWRAHLLALRHTIEHWIPGHLERKERLEKVKSYLHVLANASADNIQAACASGNYTHVHILAHGSHYQDGHDKRYGLALYSRTKEAVDVVSGSRLAAALRPSDEKRLQKLCRPTVVTLAVCEGGQQGGVIGSGGSLAHTLHAADIPVVIASQFPLTFVGSVIMVQRLYGGMLFGDDPRACLLDLRRCLRAQDPGSVGHDWASVVAYASLPPQTLRELFTVKVEAYKRWLFAKYDCLEHELEAWEKKLSEGDRRVKMAGLMEETSKDLETLCQEFEGLAKSGISEEERIWILALMGSARKREAVMRFRILHSEWRKATTDGEKKAASHEKKGIVDCLEKAAGHYRRAFNVNRRKSWPMVQNLALSLLLDIPVEEGEYATAWLRADVLADIEGIGDGNKVPFRILSDQLEIHLLALMYDGQVPGGDLVRAKLGVGNGNLGKFATDQARKIALGMYNRRTEDPTVWQATIYQIQRCARWFVEIAEETCDEIPGLKDGYNRYQAMQIAAKEVLAILSPERKAKSGAKVAKRGRRRKAAIGKGAVNPQAANEERIHL